MNPRLAPLCGVAAVACVADPTLTIQMERPLGLQVEMQVCTTPDDLATCFPSSPITTVFGGGDTATSRSVGIYLDSDPPELQLRFYIVTAGPRECIQTDLTMATVPSSFDLHMTNEAFTSDCLNEGWCTPAVCCPSVMCDPTDQTKPCLDNADCMIESDS